MLFSLQAAAEVEIGVGMNSFTGGRHIPALHLAYASADQAYTWSATGVRSGYYYQASHQIAYYRTWNSGTFWGSDVSSGFGGALAYSARSFQDENATSEDTTSDILLGPAMRVNLSYGVVFIDMSITFGLRNFMTHLSSLTFQDVEFLAMGVRF